MTTSAIASTDVEATPAQEASVLGVLGVPDITGIDIDALPIESQVELYAAIDGYRERVRATLAGLLADLTDAQQQVIKNVAASMLASGTHRLPHETFDVVRKQKFVKQKKAAELAKLRDLLPSDEWAELAKRVVTIDSNLDDQSLATLRAALPLARIKETVDYSGTVLNRLIGTGAKGYGPDSEIGRIVAAGYVDEPVGEPYIEITVKPSAMKRVGGNAS